MIRKFDYYVTGSSADRPGRHPRGGAALMGGGTDQDAAFRFLAQRADGGDFLVLRASGEGAYNEYVAGLAPLDSVETLVLHDREAASDPFVLEKVRGAEAIFLAGGDQSKYMEWAGTPLGAELQAAVDRGAPIGGTSAGLAVLGEQVFSARLDSVTSSEALADPFHPTVTVEPGPLQVPHMQGWLTDTHFSQRDRLGRLATFMARAETPVRGLGVDERTAVLLHPNGQGIVVGEHAAHFVTAPTAPEVCLPGQPLTWHGLQVQSLQAGETFNFVTGEAEGSSSHTLDIDQGVLNIK